MIRVGFASDPQNAFSLYNTARDGYFSAGVVLAGFGTEPIPGAICDDGIAKAVQFAAHHIQKVLSALLQKESEDMTFIQSAIMKQLGKISSSVSYISNVMGQGIYLSGCVVFTAGEKYFCIPFGGACAYLWDGSHFADISSPLSSADQNYIRDALGGPLKWGYLNGRTMEHTESLCGPLPTGAQLMCMTCEPPKGVLPVVMENLASTDQSFVAITIHDSFYDNEVPVAVLDFLQAPDFASKEVNDSENEATA